MQTFYSQLFADKQEKLPLMEGLLRIAKARLKDVLAVKAAPAWDIWDESAEPSAA